MFSTYLNNVVHYCSLCNNVVAYFNSYRYKLEILGIDGKFKARFVFWDSDCVKLIGKSALQMKTELIEVLFISSTANQFQLLIFNFL